MSLDDRYMQLDDPAPRPVLDLSQILYENTKHGIRMMITNFWDAANNNRRPCMVLIPALADPRRATPVIISLDQMHEWAEETCDEVALDAHVADLAPLLHMDPLSKRQRRQIKDVVRSHLNDLFRAEVFRPEPGKTPVARVVMEDQEGKVVDEKVIRENV